MLRPRPNVISMNQNCVVKVVFQHMFFPWPPKCTFISSSLLAVLIELIGLGSLQSDIKSIASTWKHISKLAIGYHTVYRALQQQQQHDPSESDDAPLDWLSKCIESICKSIEENVQKSVEAVNNDLDSHQLLNFD